MEGLCALQDVVTNWGCLLIAMGGALKPAKHFYNLISFKLMAAGAWQYEPNHDNPAFQICVPLANSDMAPIGHLLVDSPSKTLESMMCLSGSSKGVFNQNRGKAQGWID
jgi:hypothetical protein